jgi:hypothetical protein
VDAVAQEQMLTSSGSVQASEAAAEARRRALLGERLPLERLQSPDVLPTGRDQRYLAGHRLLGGPLESLKVGNMAVGGIVQSTATYDSNIDGERDGSAAGVLATSVAVEARSILQRHAFALLGSLTATGVLPDVGQSDVSGTLGAAGRLDLSRRDALDLTLAYSHQLTSPEAPDRDSQESEETTDQISGGALYQRQYRRASFSFGGGLTTTMSEDDSENSYISPSLEAGFAYELTPRLAVQATPSFVQTIYPDDGSEGTERDSRTFTFSVGANYQPGRTTSATLSIGYQVTEFSDSSLDSESGVVLGAGLNRRLDERTALGLQATRTFDPTTDVDDTAGATITEVAAELQRALGARLLADFGLGASLAEFAGSDRKDLILRASGGLAFALNEVVNLTLDYRYSETYSDEDEAAYHRHTVSVGIAMRF